MLPYGSASNNGKHRYCWRTVCNRNRIKLEVSEAVSLHAETGFISLTDLEEGWLTYGKVWTESVKSWRRQVWMLQWMNPARKGQTECKQLAQALKTQDMSDSGIGTSEMRGWSEGAPQFQVPPHPSKSLWPGQLGTQDSHLSRTLHIVSAVSLKHCQPCLFVFITLGPPHPAHSSGAHVSLSGLSAPVPVMAKQGWPPAPHSPDLLGLVPAEPGPPAGPHPSLPLIPGIPRNGAAPMPSVCPASGWGGGMGLGCQTCCWMGPRKSPWLPGGLWLMQCPDSVFESTSPNYYFLSPLIIYSQ